MLVERYNSEICTYGKPTERCESPMWIVEVADGNPLGAVSFIDEEDGEFVPLGGHKDAWIYSPTAPGTSFIVKKTSIVEGAAYARIFAKQLNGLNVVLKRGLSQHLTETEWCAKYGRKEYTYQLSRLATFVPFVQNIWTGGSGSCYVDMENLTSIDRHRSRAAYCAMDIKVGTQLWGLDASPYKRRRMEYKALLTTAAETGLCLIGYRCRDAKNHNVVKSLSRQETRQIRTEKMLRDALDGFFSLAPVAVQRGITDQIRELRHFFQTQTLAHFHSSSLLIIYDSTGQVAPSLRIIDLAHASFFHDSINNSFLHGLDTLLAYLERKNDEIN